MFYWDSSGNVLIADNDTKGLDYWDDGCLYVSADTPDLYTALIGYSADVATFYDRYIGYNADTFTTREAFFITDQEIKWPITFHVSDIISEDVINWPCLITDIHIPAEAWTYLRQNPGSLRFSADVNGDASLAYDAVRLDTDSQSCHIYVRVPVLSSTTDTVIYAWAGGTAFAPSAEEMQTTYRSDIVVWLPIEEGTGTTTYDRTANDNDAVFINSPIVVPVYLDGREIARATLPHQAREMQLRGVTS